MPNYSITYAYVVIAIGLTASLCAAGDTSSTSIDARIDGVWQEIAAGTIIGVRRIMKLPTTLAEAVRLRITSSRACPTISTLEVYQAP